MQNPLSFGYLYDFRNPLQWRRPWADLYAETLDFIAWTEELGFEGTWVPEHHGAVDGYMPSPLIALSAIAARTSTMKLGSGVALGPLYHPVRFAEDCAVLDILSNGRLEMTLAVGYRRKETDGYGVEFGSRGRRMDEFLEIVRRLWRGESFSFQGDHFKLNNASIIPSPAGGKIPLYLGGYSDKAFERIGKYADGYFGDIELCELYLEKVRAIGKDPYSTRVRALDLFLVVATDPEKAKEELSPYFHYVNNIYGSWLLEDVRGPRLPEHIAMHDSTLEAFKESGKLRILTPGQAIDMFRTMQARAPIEHFAMMTPPGLPLTRFAEYAELFAREVMPEFR